MAKFAAAMLEAHEDDLVFENGMISVKGAPASGKSFASVASFAYIPVPLPEGLEPGLSDEAFFEPSNNTYPFGCHISMLEIDRSTGEPTLLKLFAVDDAGNRINPLIVEGQIHGGLAQGIGQAMIEEVVYDENGQLVTGSFMDYAIPRAIDFPRFELTSACHAHAREPAGREGRRRGRHTGLDAQHRRRGRRRAQRVRRETHRHDAASRKALAHHPGRPIVIPTAFEYTRAASVDDALAKLRAANGEGKLIAGGHSLIPVMKLRLSQPGTLIDIAPHLRAVRDSARRAARLEIGAGTVHHDVATSAMLQQECPMLAETAASIGDPQVRNRGTLGGSLAHADPSADYPAAMLALDADIHVEGTERARASSRRGISSAGSSRSIWRRTRSSSPCSSLLYSAAAYAKLYQRASHFAIVGVAAALDVNNGVDRVRANRRHRRKLARHSPDGGRRRARRKTAERLDHRGCCRVPRAPRWRTSTPTSMRAASTGAR